MIKLTKALTALIILLLIGCVSAPQPHVFVNSYSGDMQMPTRSPEDAIYTIEGSGFLKTMGGDTKDCAGANVNLTEETIEGAYEREVNGLSSRVLAVTTVDPEFLSDRRERSRLLMSKSTQCDVDGKFEFTGVEPGLYTVSTRITWNYVGTCGYGQYQSACTKETGGRAWKLVRVDDNPNKLNYKVVVTR